MSKPTITYLKDGTQVTTFTAADGAKATIYKQDGSIFGEYRSVVLTDASEVISLGHRTITNTKDRTMVFVENGFFPSTDEVSIHSNKDGKRYKKTGSVAVIDDVGDSIMRNAVQKFAQRHQGDSDFLRTIAEISVPAHGYNGKEVVIGDMLKTPSHFSVNAQGNQVVKSDKPQSVRVP